MGLFLRVGVDQFSKKFEIFFLMFRPVYVLKYGYYAYLSIIKKVFRNKCNIKMHFETKIKSTKSQLRISPYLIQLIWNVSENKVDFSNFPNTLYKIKYLGPNLNINSLILTLYSKILFYANNRFTTLGKV